MNDTTVGGDHPPRRWAHNVAEDMQSYDVFWSHLLFVTAGWLFVVDRLLPLIKQQNIPDVETKLLG